MSEPSTAEAVPDADVVLRQVSDGVALLTLNRPDRLNAWTGAMERRYFDLLQESADDPDVRVIVVTGAGRGFCAGADMDDLQAIGRAGGMRGSRRPQTFPLGIPKPIIAAMNGAAAGVGLVQALMCDIRFAAAGAKLTTSFARRGLVAEHGMSWMLPRLVGQAAALDLLLSARVVLAEEAAEMGLVNKVLPPTHLLDHTMDYARDIATNCAPASLATIKAQVYDHLDTGLSAALEDSNRLMAKSLAAPDFNEGVASFLERRPPRFAPLER
ncbi:MAG TPA: enoyl-CoA hydratase [Acidimicrobiales bacterium]|nr:enoyl-CoA hydratase [Acidimicrobiales bacterium]